MKKSFLLISLFSVLNQNAQELYPHDEPASTIPKNVLGLRQFNETYKESGIYRNMFCMRLMYGLLPKLTVMSTVSLNNHHGEMLPPGLVTHTHNGNQTVYSTGNFKRGVLYPYKVNGVYLYAKYRFLTFDGQNKHLRFAAYADWSNNKTAHDEAEPNLVDDTRGFGGGLIITALKKKFAVNAVIGFIKPGYYEGFAIDPNDSTLVPTKVQYGNAVRYSLSFGYLVYPFKYKSYNQTNISLYVEMFGRSYGAAKVTQYGFVNVPIQTPLLQSGSYVEMHPGIQAIFNSNLRVDFSVGFPMINKSYVRFYPVFMLGVQRYFYFGKK